MQQRLGVLSLALLSSICAGSTALAGPLSLNPQSQPAVRSAVRVAPQAAPEQAYAQQPLAEPASPEPRTRYAAAQNMDLIIMGTHGRGFVGHVVMGNVAEKVVRTAPCPVLTVRNPNRRFLVADEVSASAGATA